MFCARRGSPARLVPAQAGAPAETYATLLDEGVYHCSIRTMYRILDDNGEVHERRQQLRHPVYQKPELMAEKPNMDHCYSGAAYRGGGVDVPSMRQMATLIAPGAPMPVEPAPDSENKLAPPQEGLISLAASRAYMPVSEMKITSTGQIHGALSYAIAFAVTNAGKTLDPEGAGLVRRGALLRYVQDVVVKLGDGADPQLRPLVPEDEVLFRYPVSQRSGEGTHFGVRALVQHAVHGTADDALDIAVIPLAHDTPWQLGDGFRQVLHAAPPRRCAARGRDRRMSRHSCGRPGRTGTHSIGRCPAMSAGSKWRGGNRSMQHLRFPVRTALPGAASAFGCDEPDGRKICLVSLCIAGQQRNAGYGGMGADEEIRKHTGSRSSTRPVLPEHLTRQEQSRPGNWIDLDTGLAQGRVNFLDAHEPDRQFRVNNAIDQQWSSDRRGFQLALGPVRPDGIAGDEIQQDVRIDERHVMLRPGSSP